VNKPPAQNDSRKKSTAEARNGQDAIEGVNRVGKNIDPLVQQLLDQAQIVNGKIYVIIQDYENSKDAIVEKYRNDILDAGVTGNVKQKTERMAHNAKANAKYQKELSKLKNMTLKKMNAVKRLRDNLMGEALEGMGYEADGEDYDKAFKFTNARGAMGGTFDYGKTEYDELDLIAGVIGNVTLMEIVLSKLKRMSKVRAINSTSR